MFQFKFFVSLKQILEGPELSLCWLAWFNIIVKKCLIWMVSGFELGRPNTNKATQLLHLFQIY